MRKGLFILFLCMFTLHGQKIDLINQTKSSCTAGYVFYGGTSGRVACDGNLTWDGTTFHAFKGYFYNTTPTTGISSIVIRQGAGQGGSAPFYIVNNANDQTMNGFTAAGGIFVSSQQGIIYYNNPANGARWLTLLANAETGSDVGSDFYMARYSDAGAFLGYPFWVKRSTGVATFSQAIAGSVTGNAATSTALAANPTDCGAGVWAISIDASGNLTCTTPTLDQIGNLAANKTFNNADKSISFNFTNPTNQPTYDGAFEIQASGAFAGDLLHVHQHTGNPGTSHLAHFEASDADVIPLHITGPTNDGSTLLADLADSDGATVFSVDSNGNIIAPTLSGNASTSTALAADPSGCTNQFTRDINASGTATCASVAGTDFANQTANYGFMGPATGGAAAPTFRALVSADIPNNAANTSGLAGTASALAANPTDCSANQYANTIAANGNLTCAQVAKTQLSDYYAPQRTKVYLTGNQAINDSAVTAIAWNGEEYDTNALHDNSTNPSRITIPAGQGGTYVLACQLSYAANATGQRFVIIGDKNATNIAVASATNAGATYSSRFTAYTEVVAAAADWFTCSAFQTSTGALNVLATAAEAFFLARRVD